jgi:hypothetical protein
MAAHRAQRKGHPQIGEISCVVGLYTAGSTSERISFHMLNEKTGNPRRRQLSKIAWANQLGLKDAVPLLQATLQDEEGTDHKPSQLVERPPIPAKAA